MKNAVIGILVFLLLTTVGLSAVLGPMNKCPTPNLRFDEYGLEGLHNGGFWYFWEQAAEGITFLDDETGDPVEITDMTLYWRSRPLKSGECYNYGNMTWYPMGMRNSQTSEWLWERSNGEMRSYNPDFYYRDAITGEIKRTPPMPAQPEEEVNK